MGKPDAPEPPDPKETSAAQTGTNIGTAVANNYMGLVNQNTPYGSLEYTFEGGQAVPQIVPIGGSTGGGKSGNLAGLLFGNPNDKTIPKPSGPSGWKVGDKTFGTKAEAVAYQQSLQSQQGGFMWTDPYTGQTYNIPKITATQTLSPEEQEKLALNQQTQINLGNLAKNQSAFLNDYMSTPFNYDVGEHEAWAGGLYDQLNNESNAQALEGLTAQLANRGFNIGTEAYDRELANLRESQMNDRSRFMLDSYNTGMNSALAQRNQPINEITALLSGSQVSHPNFVNSNTAQIPTTDVAGNINQNYNQQLGIWQQDQANAGSTLGGLFGLAAGGLAGGYF